MEKSAITAWLDRGRVLYTGLVRETLEFHKVMESMDEAGIKAFVGKRQEMLERIQKFDADLAAHMQGKNWELKVEEKRKVEEFVRLREALVRKATETDASIILHTKRQMASLRDQLNRIVLGREVIRNYRGERLERADQFDLSA